MGDYFSVEQANRSVQFKQCLPKKQGLHIFSSYTDHLISYYKWFRRKIMKWLLRSNILSNFSKCSLVFLKYSDNFDIWLLVYPFFIQEKTLNTSSVCYVSNTARCGGGGTRWGLGIQRKTPNFFPPWAHSIVWEIGSEAESYIVITVHLEQEQLRKGKVSKGGIFFREQSLE